MINMMVLPNGWLVAMAWLNFAICTGIGWACLCRVAKMSVSTTRKRFRAGYTLLMVAASCSGLSPVLWGDWPGPGQIGMSIAALYVIGWGVQNWRSGPPDYARRSPAVTDW